jgi:ELWxxDGT repeat protein
MVAPTYVGATTRSHFTRNFFKLGTSIFFAAYEPTNGRELYKYNGTSVVRVTELNPTDATTTKRNSIEDDSSAVVMGSKLYFAASKTGTDVNDNNSSNKGLYSIDESATNATFVARISPSELFVMNSTTLLISGTPWTDGSLEASPTLDGANRALFKSSGVANNLELVKSGVDPWNFVKLDSRVYFMSDVYNEKGIWRTDGTTAGTTQMLIPGLTDSNDAFNSGNTYLYANEVGGYIAALFPGEQFMPPWLWVADNSSTAFVKLVEGAGAPTPLGDAFFYYGTSQNTGDSEPFITKPSSNAQLKDLKVFTASAAGPSFFPLTPTFSSSVLKYGVDLTAPTRFLRFSFEAADQNAIIKFDGAVKDLLSGPIQIDVLSPRFVLIEVTAQDGTTKLTYEIAISIGGVAPTTTTSTTAPTSETSGGGIATTVAPVATTVAPVATTVAPVATSTAVVPGVTVTDTKVYTKSVPKKVAAGSAIAVMTPAQAKTRDIETLTPRVCLPANDDLVFIKTGRCVAQIVSEKTGKVLRRLTTRVVADEVSEINVGNEIVTLAPIYFGGASASVDAKAKKRLQSIKDRISAAGTVLLVGHSGILMGNTPENQEMGRARAIATRNKLRDMGAKGPFFVTSAGALAPASTKMTQVAQAKNRRVVIVLIP